MRGAIRALTTALGFICLGLGGAAAAGDPGLIFIHAGTLLAVPGEAPLSRQTVIVENGRITNVIAGFVAPKQARVIDLSDSFVLPGLMDLHVHLTLEPKPGAHLRAATQSAADLALIAARNARRTLQAGFTTVVDLGRPGTPAHETAIFALRDAIEAGTVPGPRILAAGSPISATGQSRRPRYRDEVEAVIGPVAVCNGADDCRRAVREQVKKGADIISFYDTGSLLFPQPVTQAMTDDEMRAIVVAAHALGRKVIADGHHAKGVAAAIRAGVDAVDSVHFPDRQTFALIKRSGVYLQSHIYAVVAAVGDSLETVDQGLVNWYPRPVLERLFRIKMKPFTMTEAYKAGVRKLAFASDSGNFPHGDNAQDFVEFVKRGMTEMDAIRTSTVNAADLLGLSGDHGRLQAGNVADLIAVAASPLDDISELTRVRFVMRAGHVYKAWRDGP